MICDDTSTEKHFDACLEYYKHPKSKVNTDTYNFHTMNHIELTDENKQKLLFKFEGIPISNEQKYQVDIYERKFRYCDYSYKYLAITSKSSKEESNQSKEEKPETIKFSKLINKKLKTVVELDESETVYKDKSLNVNLRINPLTNYKEDKGGCLVDIKDDLIEDSYNNEKNEIDKNYEYDEKIDESNEIDKNYEYDEKIYESNEISKDYIKEMYNELKNQKDFRKMITNLREPHYKNKTVIKSTYTHNTEKILQDLVDNGEMIDCRKISDNEKKKGFEKPFETKITQNSIQHNKKSSLKTSDIYERPQKENSIEGKMDFCIDGKVKPIKREFDIKTRKKTSMLDLSSEPEEDIEKIMEVKKKITYEKVIYNFFSLIKKKSFQNKIIFEKVLRQRNNYPYRLTC